MRHLNFLSFPADIDVWMRLEQKSDGSSCYAYVFLYTDYVLEISENLYKVLREGMNDESVGPPKIYIGE